MKVTSTFHDRGGRKYIGLDFRLVKVPWRYNRVIGVEVQGMVPVQMLRVGADVQAEIAKRVFGGEEFLVLKKIAVISNGL